MARRPFFTGDYGSALGRIDTRPIIEAGRAQGQMFAGLGAEAAKAIETYQSVYYTHLTLPTIYSV